ncbi:hypothetical protein [Stieleria varia]|uniref:Secreted protein n=1 Tax=Stieleria varia TaxID=2528005 RepID=A0A5C6AZI2_9BACT|nr:hypothetical protein [Stieleria varia]TWU04579.1 hypothetical protein Pla52n_26210 [Stieleria varia]
MNLTIIRIAATACLIVSTTIQPMVALAMLGNCADEVCEQSQMCLGCGCCEVQSSSDRCCCCTPETEPAKQPINDDDQSTQESSVVLVAASPEVSRCTCGISPPPMDRTTPRDLVVRERSIRLSMLDFVVLDDSPAPVERPRVIDDSFGSRADFSQRVLCVWRI